MPQTADRPLVQIARFYTDQYADGRITSYCPEGSNSSLLRKGQQMMETLPDGSHILDLGSGNFYFARLLQAHYKLHHAPPPHVRIISVDYARLVKPPHLKTSAVRADGAKLPFKDSVFEAVVSNLAMDYMGENAIADLLRVLKPGAKAFINLMQEGMLPSTLSRINLSELTIRQRDTYDACKYLADNRLLYNTAYPLQQKYESHGFKVHSLAMGDSQTKDKWWELEVQKPNA